MGNLTIFSINGNLLSGHLPLDNPFSAIIQGATIGGGGTWIGCVPSWATMNIAIIGEENLGLPNCGTPPGESVWVLDTVLAPPSPVRGSSDTGMTKTRLTLRATYTIPTEYVTSTTTTGKIQFRSMSATAATGGTMTATIALPAPATSTPARSGFDNRASGTGAPAATPVDQNYVHQFQRVQLQYRLLHANHRDDRWDARNSPYPS